MPTTPRYDLPKPIAANRPVYPTVLRSERAGGRAVLGSLALRGDSQARLFLGVTSSDQGALELGSGAGGRDVRFRRTAAGGSVLDSNGAAVTTDFQVAGAAGQSAYNSAVAGAGGAALLRAFVLGDVAARAQLEGDAIVTGLFLGTGAGTPDIRLYRSAARQLTFDSNGIAGAVYLQIHGNAATDTGIYADRTGDTVAPWALVAGTGTTPELSFGSGAAARDIRVSRGIAGQLVVDALGTATGTLIDAAATAGQQAHIRAYVAGDTDPRALLRGDATLVGLLLGPGSAAQDLRAYRSGAKVLTIDDTAGGAVTLNVKSTIQQNGTGVSVIGHGAADHADITRKVFLTPRAAQNDSSTTTTIGASPDLTIVLQYADAATQGAYWLFEVPDDWASGVITVQPVWSPGSTDAVAHTVRWSLVSQAIVAGTTITAAGTTVTFTGASAARTVGVVVFDTATSTTLTPAAAGDLFRINLRRIGADAADTYVGAVNVIGLIVTYTANQ